ncbi:hypothetical protein [Paracidovorax cattleyae]|uniref:Uncharacterized protein n=1 Tax=Paracidovorax cattleyae TaxID=80868 RepID=A0A1H0RF19_9BURK|nr:hypothetical protein [Paracidovorax cattleyae]SDP28153.1 hypothetical protein SAMN04489708_11037 [Paracidovorax cattleyae]
MTEHELDHHLNAVLKAAGSALRHYTFQKSLDDMRAAMRSAVAAGAEDADPGYLRGLLATLEAVEERERPVIVAIDSLRARIAQLTTPPQSEPRP